MMKQVGTQITDESARQMADLAVHWGLPRIGRNTAVVERAVALVFMLEVGYDRYQRRIAEITREEA